MAKDRKIQYSDILKKLETLSDPKAVEGMVRYGINPENTYGVSIPNLRRLTKEIGVDHALAQQLWASGIHEARILASMVDDPKMVTEEQVEGWVNDLDSWDVCDQCCMNLFKKTKFAYQKATEWSLNNKEFTKRAGFVLMACLAVSDKKADDRQFEPFFPLIKREAADNRNFVKKAVNWALRQIGKRSLNLNRKAIETAEEIQRMGPRSAKWVASDAIRELASQAVQERLRNTDR
ncbi:DNA alkylation repair protein [Chloroflexota bacterium]